MERIIADAFVKGEKRTWSLDPENLKNQEFNRKIVAVNEMYGWLYRQGVLDKVSFEFKDYSDITFFAFDAKDLAPYRKEMELSGVKDAVLAVQHIFDIEYTPCLYSGAIELSWSMFSYRDFDGTVSRSWECELCRHLDAAGVLDVEQVKAEKGVKEAVKYAFDISGFEPSDCFRVRALDEDDRSQVEILDDASGNDVACGIDSEEWAWGVFLNQELIGYCTLGGADVDTAYDKFKEWTQDSLCLCDVFVKEEHRGKGAAFSLVKQVLEKGNSEDESVFLTLLDDRLSSFYEKLGFKMLGNGNMVRTSNSSFKELTAQINEAQDLPRSFDGSSLGCRERNYR